MNSPLLTPHRVLVALVAAGLCLVVLNPVILLRLGVAFHGQWFLDSYALLAANDAVRAGIDVTHSNPLDPLNRWHIYSDWWLLLGNAGLTREHNFLLGGLWAAAFLAVALASVRPASLREAALLALILLSPPHLLALHRANNDLAIFTLLGLPLLWLQRGVTLPPLAAFGAAVALATGLKYYPIVAVAAPLVALPWGARAGWLAGGIALLAGLALLDVADGLGRATGEMPQTIYQFGAPVIWRDLELSRPAVLALTLLVMIGGAALAMRRRWTVGLADDARGTPGERLLFACGALLLLGCFLAGTSFIYRWIFGLWLWPWLARQARALPAPAPRVAVALWIISLWTDGLCCVLVNSLGLAFRPGAGWRLWTQAVNWALMIMLAGWLLEAIRARFTAWRSRSRVAEDAA